MGAGWVAVNGGSIVAVVEEEEQEVEEQEEEEKKQEQEEEEEHEEEVGYRLIELRWGNPLELTYDDRDSSL